VGLAGLAFKDVIESHLRSPLVIGVATIGFGLLLWWADVHGRRDRCERDMTWRDVVLIGAAQALALIPGTSRSGATITAGLAVGLTRAAAARFSFLLSIPVIVLAGGLETLELMANPYPGQWGLLLTGAVIAGLSAYLCIHFFLQALERMGMLPFVIYRLVLGVGLLLLFA
jgi:undecaprenyl-diphosphatase